MHEKKYFCETCIKNGSGIAMTERENEIHKEIHPEHKTVSIDQIEDDGL